MRRRRGLRPSWLASAPEDLTHGRRSPPHLIELVAAIATIILDWLAVQVRARCGIQIEAHHREALHSALMTAVRHALARGLQDRGAVAQVADKYVRTSVPDALAVLKPREQQLIEMAKAKLQEGRPG